MQECPRVGLALTTVRHVEWRPPPRGIFGGDRSLSARAAFLERENDSADWHRRPSPPETEAVGELSPVRARLALAPDASIALRIARRCRWSEEESIESVVWHDAFNRRLLALGDIAAASVALVVLLNVFSQRRVAAVALAGIALLLFLFKVSGLYERDELRLVHSTLDEVPLLVQLTGLFALSLAILQSILLAGSLSATRIAALWIASFGTILCGRIVVRAMAALHLATGALFGDWRAAQVHGFETSWPRVRLARRWSRRSRSPARMSRPRTGLPLRELCAVS